MVYNSKEQGLVTKPKREKWQKEKEKEQREERTYCPSFGRKRIAYDIWITGHNALLSKAIKAIGINHPRKVWRVNELTDSRLILLKFSTIRSHDKQGKRKGREEAEIEHIPE